MALFILQNQPDCALIFFCVCFQAGVLYAAQAALTFYIKVSSKAILLRIDLKHTCRSLLNSRRATLKVAKQMRSKKKRSHFFARNSTSKRGAY